MKDGVIWGTYEGTFNDQNLPHGSGMFTWTDGMIYKEMYSNGKREGVGYIK